MGLRFALGVVLSSGICIGATCQTVGEGSERYDRRQSFGVYTEYSNDSSHIIVGYAQQRKIAGLGFTYDHRIVSGRHATYHLMAEVTPVLFLRNPTAYHSLLVLTAPIPQTIEGGYFANTPPPNQKYPDGTLLQGCFPSQISQSVPIGGGMTFAGTQYNRCGTRWVYGGAVSPFGQKLNFRPSSRLQPFIMGTVGFVQTTVEEPIPQTSSFNFSAQFGGGVELYLDHHRSVSAEFRYHHISNAQIGDNNPGIDSGLFKVTYTIGR